jgi:hypothetical protein
MCLVTAHGCTGCPLLVPRAMLMCAYGADAGGGGAAAGRPLSKQNQERHALPSGAPILGDGAMNET